MCIGTLLNICLFIAIHVSIILIKKKYCSVQYKFFNLHDIF